MTAPRSETGLERDLRAGSRDGLYRALSYLERCGAPVASAPPEVERMRIEAATALDWLAGRDDRLQIAGDYETFLERWSPLFQD